MLRRFVAWVRFRWHNRRKPGRFSAADLERDRWSRVPESEQCDRSPRLPDSL